MTPKRLPPDDPREWLRRANSNLVHARDSSHGVCLEDLCFDAQQTAEKAIKSVFVLRGERFPLIHDLEDLLQRLERNGVKIPQYLWNAAELSRFAVVTRYPGLSPLVTARKYRRAIRIAETVVRWAERLVEAAVKKRVGRK